MNNKTKHYLSGLLLVGFIGLLIYYFLFLPSNEELVNFINIDRQEVLNEFDILTNKLDNIAIQDSALGVVINSNELIGKIELYREEYNELQDQNLEALSNNDLLKSREIKKKINALPEKYNLTPNMDNNYTWNFGSNTFSSDDSVKIGKFTQFIEDEVYTITLKASNSCGVDTTSRKIMVLPPPTFQMIDSLNEE